MRGCVVNVATGPFVKGQRRLCAAIDEEVLVGSRTHAFVGWSDELPAGSPSHADVPYAFKAHALAAAAALGHKRLLWADACILPVTLLSPFFDRIAREGYWISRNGWTNAQWTADSAYADLGISREENARVPHVVATAFGVCMDHPVGQAVLAEYLRLAKTRAFCGPWRNTPETPCGDASVLGHRHDQTALSVIAWKLGLELTDPPDIFAYKGGETAATVLIADGAY